jgi:hypothetical protein
MNPFESPSSTFSNDTTLPTLAAEHDWCDQSLPTSAAEHDRRDFASSLEEKLGKTETAADFRERFERLLNEYNTYSDAQRVSNGASGMEERSNSSYQIHHQEIEFIIKLISDGALKNAVASEWDALKAKCIRNACPPHDRRALTGYDSSLSETKAARQSSNTSGNGSGKQNQKRKFNHPDKELNTVSNACKFIARGLQCKFGSNCRFSHVRAEASCTSESPSDGKKFPRLDGAKDSGKQIEGGRGKMKSGKTGKGRPGGRGNSDNLNSQAQVDSSVTHTVTKPGLPVYCNRCKVDHRGQIGNECVHPPCRFCTWKGRADSDHHLRNCPHKPEQWTFQLIDSESNLKMPESIRISSARE